MRLVMIGAPGAGKGTQADRLAERLAIPHVSTGDLFRAHLAQGTELGQLAQGFMRRGQLVPDDVTEAMAWERLAANDARSGYILDGFPRTVLQAKHLEERLQANKVGLDAVVYLLVDEAVLELRLTGRRSCPQCKATYHVSFKPPKTQGICDVCGAELVQRADDKPETVQRRLQVYLEETAPVIDYYSERGPLLTIHGEGPADQITGTIIARLGGGGSDD